MEKSLSSVPLLTGRENYKEWTLAIKAAAYWSGFWNHYTDKDMLVKITKPEPVEGVDPPKLDAKDLENIADLNKLEMKVQGALMMTVSMVIKLDLDALKTLGATGHLPSGYIVSSL
jgi:hypothetical protein